jgi:hypothetical protein
MTVSLKLNETKRRMVYVSLKRTETDTVYPTLFRYGRLRVVTITGFSYLICSEA